MERKKQESILGCSTTVRNKPLWNQKRSQKGQSNNSIAGRPLALQSARGSIPSRTLGPLGLIPKCTVTNKSWASEGVAQKQKMTTKRRSLERSNSRKWAWLLFSVLFCFLLEANSLENSRENSRDVQGKSAFEESKDITNNKLWSPVLRLIINRLSPKCLLFTKYYIHPTNLIFLEIFDYANLRTAQLLQK